MRRNRHEPHPDFDPDLLGAVAAGDAALAQLSTIEVRPVWGDDAVPVGVGDDLSGAPLNTCIPRGVETLSLLVHDEDRVFLHDLTCAVRGVTVNKHDLEPFWVVFKAHKRVQ